MGNGLLSRCIKKGFLIEKELFEILNELEYENSLKIIDILINVNNGKVLTKDLYNENLLKFIDLVSNNKIDGVKILTDNSFKSKKINIDDFVFYFKSRFEKIKDLLIKKGFNDLCSIRRLDFSSKVCTIIAMVSSKKITKNKNLLIEIEDLTGRVSVLVNSENKILFEKAQDLMLDDIIAFNVSGSNKMLFVSDFIFPDIKLDSEKINDIDEFVAFTGNFHIGSKMFLEKNLLKFVNWLNGEIGDERQRKIAKKVKYLFLVGDNINGVGIYPGQEKFLKIKSCREQYQKLEEILKKIRKDVLIVMCPGQNDAVWLGEPQNKISEKWALGLSKMENLFLVSNPSEVKIGSGFRVLVYHGSSVNNFISEIPKFRFAKITSVMREILKRRHLSPSYGLGDCIPFNDDKLVIDNIPDIVVMGNSCKIGVEYYNNILMVSTSCWNKKKNSCKVPLFNLKTREIKVMDFEENDVKWEEKGDLICKINGEEK